MDTAVEDFLRAKDFANIKLISLNEMETVYPELLKLKQTRSRAEYCFTLTPYSVQYALHIYKLSGCTYLDADILFYDNPNLILAELGDNSVLITEHRYTPDYDQSKVIGKYCVQFIYFKNDSYGHKALEWWRQSCAAWCSVKHERGQFGDQKYLDDWTARFERVFVPGHLGCGVAPWNIQQYDLIKRGKRIIIKDKITKKEQPLVFVHFQGIKKYYLGRYKVWTLHGYEIAEIVKDSLFNPYILNLLAIEQDLPPDFISAPRRMILLKRWFDFLWFWLKNIGKSFCFNRQYREYQKYRDDVWLLRMDINA
jgi:hypothetical protein